MFRLDAFSHFVFQYEPDPVWFYEIGIHDNRMRNNGCFLAVCHVGLWALSAGVNNV